MLKRLAHAAGLAAASAAIAFAPYKAGAEPLKAGSAYEFSFEAIDGTPLPMTEFEGKVVLVVNTASMCGFTSQYEGLQALYERHKDAGFVVLGVPSNDFGGQEPKNNSEIANFCKGAFGVTFPLAAKTSVVGPQAHPFYRWALSVLGAKSAPRWNFHKYLVDRDGKLAAAFGTPVAPNARELEDAVRNALDRPTKSAGLQDKARGPAIAAANGE